MILELIGILIAIVSVLAYILAELFTLWVYRKDGYKKPLKMRYIAFMKWAKENNLYNNETEIYL